MHIEVGTVNPLVHWIHMPFSNRFRILFRGLNGFRGIGFRIPLRGLFGFWVTPGLLYIALDVFFFGFKISWLHSYVLPYWVVFCDIIRHICFRSFFPEYIDFFLYSVNYPIKSHVYFSRLFMFCQSIHDAIYISVVSCHWCWWL